MAKVLVDAGAQDIPVGTPIFVTVDDAEFVAAFKDFAVAAESESETVAAETVIAETVAAAEPAPTPVVVAEKEVVVAAAAPAPAVVAAVVAAAEPVPVAEKASAAAVPLVFRRDWGSGVSSSPLAHRLSAEQKKYIERFGPTLQQPLDL
ncbi:unnamed protein product [Laminaria digitata]